MPPATKKTPVPGSLGKPKTPRQPTVHINLNIQGKGLAPDDDTPVSLPKVKITTELEKLLLSLQKAKPGLLGDQRRRLVSSMGCVSNPGGPGC